MDKDRYFERIYKPKNVYEKNFGLNPRLSAAFYPVENDA